MFTDIIRENQLLTDPTLIKESYRELEFIQRDFLREASEINLSESISSEEADTKKATAGLISRLIAYFRKMITKLREWIDRKFKLTEKQIDSLVKLIYKRGDYESIEVKTCENINKLEPVMDLVEKASDELKKMEMSKAVETIMNKGYFKGVATSLYGMWKGTFLGGYVDSLKKYNGMDIDKIKSYIFGNEVLKSGIKIGKFNKYVKNSMEFRTKLTEYDKEYSHTLTTVHKLLDATDNMNAINADLQNKLMKIANMVTAFYNRNINLIMSIIIEVTNVTLSTAGKMASKSGVRLVPEFESKLNK